MAAIPAANRMIETISFFIVIVYCVYIMMIICCVRFVSFCFNNCKFTLFLNLHFFLLLFCTYFIFSLFFVSESEIKQK